jgi:DNA-binding beta-propeller fold protein YncE
MREASNRIRDITALTLVTLVSIAALCWSGETGYAQTVIATIPVGAGPNSIAVDAALNRIYVGSESGTLYVLDGDTNTLIATRHYHGRPTVNRLNHRVYLADWDSAAVTVLNGSTLAELEQVFVDRPMSGALALNSSTNRIYVGLAGGHGVQVLDGETNSVVSVHAA